VPIPERLISILGHRIEGRAAGEPAIMSPKGSRLGLESWKRAVSLAAFAAKREPRFKGK
jgi:hypothetical protein